MPAGGALRSVEWSCWLLSAGENVVDRGRLVLHGCEESTEGLAPVAEAEFLFARGFGEGAAEGRAVEQGIVAETIGSAGFV